MIERKIKQNRKIINQKNVLEYLEKSAKDYPNKIAVQDGKMSLTYEGALDLARKIGSALTKYTDTKTPIPIIMEKNVLNIATIWGALYAGCYYVPISLGQPVVRIEKILEQLDAEIVITDTQGKKKLSGALGDRKVLIASELSQEKENPRILEEIRNQCERTDLLYVLFTSGSTGVPKGIKVSHDSVIKFINHFVKLFEINSSDVIGNQAPYDFDVSVKDMYSAIATGATLVLISKKLFAIPPKLIDYLCEYKVTTLIWAVPALCMISAMKGFEYRVPTTVNKVLFSGQTMPAAQLRKWQEALPDATFVNLYGPTEITCNCTYYIVDKKIENDDTIPLGNAIPGRRVYLLNKDMKEISRPFEHGEICVAGESLSEGYLGMAEETERVFVSRGKGNKEERIYKTGDMAFYGDNHNLYFAGRSDFQIKRMGHRIELEEIEASINRLDGVELSCCAFDKEKNLIHAFYQGDSDEIVVKHEIRKQIPAYMCPNGIFRIARIPITKNGKVHREYLLEMARCNVE